MPVFSLMSRFAEKWVGASTEMNSEEISDKKPVEFSDVKEDSEHEIESFSESFHDEIKEDELPKTIEEPSENEAENDDLVEKESLREELSEENEIEKDELSQKNDEISEKEPQNEEIIKKSDENPEIFDHETLPENPESTNEMMSSPKKSPLLHSDFMSPLAPVPCSPTTNYLNRIDQLKSLDAADLAALIPTLNSEEQDEIIEILMEKHEEFLLENIDFFINFAHFKKFELFSLQKNHQKSDENVKVAIQLTNLTQEIMNFSEDFKNDEKFENLLKKIDKKMDKFEENNLKILQNFNKKIDKNAENTEQFLEISSKINQNLQETNDSLQTIQNCIKALTEVVADLTLSCQKKKK